MEELRKRILKKMNELLDEAEGSNRESEEYSNLMFDFFKLSELLIKIDSQVLSDKQISAKISNDDKTLDVKKTEVEYDHADKGTELELKRREIFDKRDIDDRTLDIKETEVQDKRELTERELDIKADDVEYQHEDRVFETETKREIELSQKKFKNVEMILSLTGILAPVIISIFQRHSDRKFISEEIRKAMVFEETGIVCSPETKNLINSVFGFLRK